MRQSAISSLAGIRYRIERKSTPLSMWFAKILIADGYLSGNPEDFCIRRTYAGHHQKSAGAWTWEMELIDQTKRDDIRHQMLMGSQYPARELKKSGFDVYPDLGSYHLEKRGD